MANKASDPTTFYGSPVLVTEHWSGMLEAAPAGRYGFGTVGMAQQDVAIAAARAAAERAGYADKYDLSAGWVAGESVQASAVVRFPAR